MKDPKRLIQILIFFGGMIVSLIAIFLVGAEKADFGDAQDYLLAANSLLENIRSYPERSLYLPFFRPPLYPVFITWIWLIFPKSIFALKLAQAAIFGANCVIIYRIGFVLTQNALSALFGALIFLGNPFLVMQATDIQTETLHTFLFSAAILFLITILTKNLDFKRSAWKPVFAGMFFGLAALCRPSALPIAVILAASLFFLKYRELKFLRSFALSTLVVAGMFLMILPWTLANYVRTNEIILINDASGYALWVGNHPKSLALYENDFRSSGEYNRYADYVLQDLADEKIAEWQKTENYSSLSLKARESLWQSDALKNMRENPQITAKLWFYKVWNFWKPFLNPTAYSAKAILISVIFLTTLFLLAFAGAKIVWTDYNNRQVIVLLGILFASATAVHVLIVSMIRYRVPYIDTYFCVLAGISLKFLWDKIRSFLQNRNLKLS